MKEQIVQQALQQFLKNGIRKMTVRELAVQLCISTKTMYKYFQSKEELLEECLKLHYSTAAEGMQAIIDGAASPVASLARIYAKALDLDFGANQLFYHDLNYYYPDVQDRVIQKNSGHALETMTGLIQQGIDEGYYLPSLKAPVVLETLTILYGSVTRSDVYKAFGKKRDLVKHTILIYLRGICTQKGLHLLNELKEFS